MKTDLPINVKKLAERLGARLSGESDHSIPITGIMTLEDAGENDLSFITKEKFINKAQNSRAAALICPAGLEIPNKLLLKVDCVWSAVLKALEMFYPQDEVEAGVHPSAIIHPDATISEDVSVGACNVIEAGAVIGPGCRVGPHCYIGKNSRIGSAVILKPGVIVMDDVAIGDRVIIHAGAVIGSDGFRYEVIRGEIVKIPQVGRVVIEDDVEIGANCCVDRAFLKETRIRRGVKLDNLVQVGHNVEIDEHTVIAAHTGLGGSSRIGKFCRLGGQSGVGDHVTVGDNVEVGGQTGVTHSIPEGARLFGTPAFDIREFMKREVILRKIPAFMKQYKKDVEEMRKALEKLSKRIEEKEKKE